LSRRLLGLASLLALLCGAARSATPSADDSNAPTTVAEQYLLSAANQERAARGLQPLHRDPQLAQAAAQHARKMAEHGTISHQFPGEAELTDRGAAVGVSFSVIAENVGEAPSVVKIHDLWMHSEHHRANLLDPSVDSAGISVIASGEELYAVEDFAKTVRSVRLEDQESTIANLIAGSGNVYLASGRDAIADARQTCALGTGYAGTRKPWFVMRFTSDSLNQLPDVLKTRLASGRYHQAAVGACPSDRQSPFTSYSFAVLLYP